MSKIHVNDHVTDGKRKGTVLTVDEHSGKAWVDFGEKGRDTVELSKLSKSEKHAKAAEPKAPEAESPTGGKPAGDDVQG